MIIRLIGAGFSLEEFLMKKIIIALFLTLVLFSSAFAQTTTEVPVINWADVEEAAADIEGSWYTFEYYNIDVWVPDVLVDTEVTEADGEGVISKFVTADNSAAMVLQYIEGNDGTPIEEVAAGITEAGGKDVEICKLNGLDALTYSLPDIDGIYVVVLPDAEDYLQFYFTPASDEGFNAVAMLITASIMPSEE